MTKFSNGWYFIHFNFFRDCPLKFIFPGEGPSEFFYRFTLPPRSLMIVPLLKRPNLLGPAIFGSFKNLAVSVRGQLLMIWGADKIDKKF